MRPAAQRNRIAFFGAIIFFILIANFFSQDVRSFFIRSTTPVHLAVQSMGIGVSRMSSGVFQFSKLTVKNETLTGENLLLSQKLIELRDVEGENLQLRQALDLAVDEDFEIAIGTVIGKNIAEDIMVIRTNKNAAIEKGMPVMTSSKVVVGKILETNGGISNVQLISAKNNSFDAKIAGKEITGVIRGTGAARIIFDLIPHDAEVQAGDIAVTSNLGGIYPENLLIGNIQANVRGGAGPYQKAAIDPYFQMSKTKTVFVLTSY